MKKSNKKILHNRKKSVSLSSMNRKFHRSNVVTLPKNNNEALTPVVYKSTGGNSVEVSYSKSSEIDTCFKNLGGELKVTLEKRFKSKFPLNQMWDCVQFRMVNPTNIPCSFNLFDGFSITPVPNTPNGYVPNLNPLGIPVMNFPPSSGSSYPSFECANINVFTQAAPLTLSKPLATVYVPTSDRIYVATQDGSGIDYILVINPNTNLVVNTIPITLGVTSWMSAYSSVSNKVYTIDQTVNISVVNCATETETAVVVLPAAASQISYSASNNYLYVTVPSLDRLYYIDCATNTIIGFISLVGGGSSVNSLVTWTRGVNNYALVLNPTNTTAFYINTTTNTLIGTFLTSNAADGFGAICYNSVKDTVYYMNNLGAINEIDMSTQTMLPTSILGLGGAFQLLFIPTFNVIYSAERAAAANASARVINCVTNVIDLSILTSITFPTIGSRFSYDDVNNTVWMTGDGNNLIVSKLCGTQGMCYIVGSEDYNEFCQDLRNNPICVRQFQFFAQSSQQVTFPMNLQTKDASGNLCTIPKLPNISLSVDQIQPNIATVDFNCKDLILDCLTTINQYPIAPNSEVNVVIYYKQIRKVDILTSKETVCGRVTETKCPDGDSRNEKQLQFQSPRPHARPKWMKPFSSSMITNGGGKGNGGNDSDKNLNIDESELGRPMFNATLTPIVTTIDKLNMNQVKRLEKSNLGTLTEQLDKPDNNLDKYYHSSVNNFDSEYGVKDKAPAENFSNKQKLNNTKKLKIKSIRGRRK